jgi:hypothetical protein
MVRGDFRDFGRSSARFEEKKNWVLKKDWVFFQRFEEDDRSPEIPRSKIWSNT